MESKVPQVVTSCRGRFHVFDQARELYRLGALHQLITDYPKSWPSHFGIPPEKTTALLFAGVINHSLGQINKFLARGLRSGINQWVHNRFSSQLPHLIPDGTDYFIGLSSYSLEALEKCKKEGIPSAVDHGSLHQEDDLKLAAEEAQRWGLKIPPNETPDWVIDKENLEFQKADSVFALSSVARDSLIRCGVSASKIFVNPCGVDLESFQPGKKEDDTFRVIQVGRVTFRKGVLTLLDAFTKAKRPDWELWFVGGTSSSSDMDSIISKFLSPEITFKPSVNQDLLKEYYTQCSVFVLASVADGFGMVVPQAMACGLPVIVTENVGAKDLIEEGVNGFIVPVGEPEIIAERLKLLHDNPELCKRMGQAARSSVLKGSSWEDYGTRLLGFIRNRVGS